MNHQECSLCGGKTRIIHHTRIADFHYCTNCEYIYKDERFHVSMEDALKIYNNHNNSIEDPRYVEFFYKFLYDAVFPYVNEGKEGFDFGSGPSPVLAQILERDHGYEMDIYDLFYAPDKVYQGKRYDLVTTTEVVEHLKDPITVFRLLKDLLKADGTLAVMTLFHKNDEEYFKNWHYIRDLSHISFYTVKTLQFIADQTGLEMIHTDGTRYATFQQKNK